MVKTIELTQNQVALVDDEDYDFLNRNKWHARNQPHIKGYYAVRAICIDKINGKQKLKTIRIHRAVIERIIGRKLKRTELVDHINNDPLDNRRENLRIVTNRQNQQNRKNKGTSRYPGVYWSKCYSKWVANIRLNGKTKHLGYFLDEREAAKAYEKACRELVGEELVCKTEKQRKEREGYLDERN